MTALDLNKAPLYLLVLRLETESNQDLYAYMQARYDACLGDKEIVVGHNFGPKYQIGPTFTYHGQQFAQIQTFAGSMVLGIWEDVRNKLFERPIIYRFNPEESFKLRQPGGAENEVNEPELIRIED